MASYYGEPADTLPPSQRRVNHIIIGSVVVEMFITLDIVISCNASILLVHHYYSAER